MVLLLASRWLSAMPHWTFLTESLYQRAYEDGVPDEDAGTRPPSKPMTVPVCRANLATLATTARIPSYDRSRLSAGIVHIGVGNFPRAHQAVYLDDLFERGLDRDWALIGDGVREDDAAVRS